LQLIAMRTGEMDGQEGPYWCSDSGAWRDVWTDTKPPLAAKVVVYRKGCSHPFTGIAHYKEYVQTKKDGSATTFWQRMPAGQLAKCAEALALRKAFPAELSGIYSDEEMHQAENGKAEEPPKSTKPETKAPQAKTPQRTPSSVVNSLVQAYGGDVDKAKERMKKETKKESSATLTDEDMNRIEIIIAEMQSADAAMYNSEDANG
jgi:hypothetical protein